MAHPGRVAVCQICSTGDARRNLEISRDVIRRAAQAGAKACFLPEASDFIVPTQQECYDLSRPISSHGFTNGLREVAKELGVWVFVGVHELPSERDAEEVKRESEEGRKVFNSLVVITDEGEVEETYRKVHLFDVALHDTSDPTKVTKTGESLRVLAGSEILDPITPSPSIGPIGLEICYDLRFPEMHRRLVERGAKVLVFPAAFTVVTGRDHWYTLLRATAIQYQVYILAPAQAGRHYAAIEAVPARTSWGESLAFDPWGRELGRLESVDVGKADEEGRMEAGFFTVDLDMGVVESVRQQIPLSIQKRPEVYAGHDRR
ncbi:Carbon-nitrogen hydrolase [Naganishia albida]|nr:Carbon-nitrogen hydrolase [Naganishia albida]